MINIMIVDDHTLVRRGIRRILEAEEDFRVVGEASNGEEALDKIAKLRPDVVLMDIAMPGLDGIEVAKRLLKKRRSTCQLLILTMYADAHYAARLLRMGAMGYMVKDAAPNELAEAIRAVHEGRRFVSGSLREAMALRYIDGLSEDPVGALTDREFQICRHLASGATNREIAEQLGLSVKTVDAHRLNILAKLGLRNNSQLTKFAIQHGIVNS